MPIHILERGTNDVRTNPHDSVRGRIYAQALQFRSGYPDDCPPIHFCPICDAMYPTRELAVACKNSNIPAEYDVGDIVLVHERYQWTDGKPEWLAAKEGKIHTFYYVVTAISYGDRRQSFYELHKPRYSVHTLGIYNGMPTGRHGWTTRDNGRAMSKADLTRVPPQVIEESQVFIGRPYNNLLG